MPKKKDLKRLVRSRMEKTGESYTTARAQLLAKTQESAPAEPIDYAALAGMANEAVDKATGSDWEAWVGILDEAGASRMEHREIARHVHEAFDVSGWWAQSVTVGYERIKGLREIGQRRSGTYSANKSRTFAVPISTLYRAFSVERTRRRWLPDVELEIRKANVDKSMRITWPDATSVQAYFTAKGVAKSQVAIQHDKLATKAEAEHQKAFWNERLTVLADVILSDA